MSKLEVQSDSSLTTEQGSARVKRLRWLCRRGMKELDILLEAFIAQNATSLADGQFADLEALLACEDDQLWDWFQGRDIPPQHQNLQRIIAHIRG